MGTLRAGAVTIGITTWNRRPLLQRALESALSQTYKNIQVVVSDDCSTDDTWDYLDQVSDLRVVKIRQTSNIGMVPNANACLFAATSEFMLMLNDDDTLLPTAIEKLVKGFLNPPGNVQPSEIGLAWCPFTNIDAHGNDLWNVRGGPAIEPTVRLIEGLFNGTRGPLCSGIMFRTADSVALGGFETRFGALADSANWGKVSLRYPYAVCVDEPLMRYLVHNNSASLTSLAQCDFWQNAIRQEIADFVAILRAGGDEQGAQILLRSGNHTLANVTMTVLMRSIGKPGWIKLFARQFWRSRSFMLTPFVFKRAIKDGWKLLRIR